MDIITWLVVGGSIGWLATRVMSADAQHGLTLNVVVGILGAVLGGGFLSPLLANVATTNHSDFSVPSVFISVLGAVILLAAASLVRRGAGSGIDRIT
jgi:uncharacterized membrane protein YeaQ/YmgE (transglycosylase-associated protein family)